MEFKQLQSLAAVVQYGSFTKAAEKLFLSQPTISTHIRQLEEELHTSLIRRTTKSIEVTPKGLEVCEYANSILELRDRMIQSCEGDQQRIIHIGASTIPSAYILPEVLPTLGQRLPDTYFVIHQSDSRGVIDGLLEGMYDLGMTGMAAEEENLESIPFCQDRMVLITPVTDRYLEMKSADTVPVEELLKEPVILREKGSGSKKSADRFLESVGIPESSLHVTARVNDPEAIKNLVAGGLGVSIISEKAAQNFVREKRLLAFPLVQPAAVRNLYLVCRRDLPRNRQVESFVQFMRTHYAEDLSAAAVL